MSFSLALTGIDTSIPFYSNVFTGQTYTSGQGVVSLRFDDGVTSEYSTFYPLLTDRSLTAGFAVVRNFINAASRLTLAEILTMQAAGMEIMCHSRTHVHPASLAAFKDESLKAASEMWMMGINAVNWVQPGWGAGDYYINDPSGENAAVDAFLRSFFVAYEAYGTPMDEGSNRYNLPRSTTYAVRHITGDTMSLVNLQAVIDACIAGGQGTEILFHATNIDAVDKITLEDFTSFLNYLQTKVGLGTLKVITPTQQLFATVAA